MKKALILFCTLLVLTMTASADVIAGPMIALSLAAVLLPILLVVGLVLVTIALIRRVRNKKEDET